MATWGEVLQRARLVPDCLVTSTNGEFMDGIEWTHRAASPVDIYFISNQRPEERLIQVSLRAQGRPPEIWNPLTGERTAGKPASVAILLALCGAGQRQVGRFENIR